MVPTSMMEDCFVVYEDLPSAIRIFRPFCWNHRIGVENGSDGTSRKAGITCRGAFETGGVKVVSRYETFNFPFTTTSARLVCPAPRPDILFLRTGS